MRDQSPSQPFSEVTAQVIPFPASARIGEARRVARIFADQRTNKAKAAYWRRTFETVGKRLAGAGIEPDESQRQLGEFRQAVVKELARIDWDAYRALLATTDDHLIATQRAKPLLSD